MFTSTNERPKTTSPIIPKIESLSFKKVTPYKSGRVVEKEVIKQLVENDNIVIAVGGGGIRVSTVDLTIEY